MKKRLLWIRSLLSLGMLLAVRSAWAHDDDNTPMDPAVLSPGFKTLGAVLIVVVVVTVWYQWRKRTMLRGGGKHRKD